MIWRVYLHRLTQQDVYNQYLTAAQCELGQFASNKNLANQKSVSEVDGVDRSTGGRKVKNIRNVPNDISMTDIVGEEDEPTAAQEEDLDHTTDMERKYFAYRI
jgi:hypothetical protein